ncbi:MAG: Response regulator receiver [Proteobacteria bacterium]|jgi:CheY-like chemotaxis protein|nr:Response regulator receiver [Pseudomonadota bacterium]
MTEQRHALIVDDHPTNRLLASALLKRLGWIVSDAVNGSMALELASQKPFRLVLLDISMPGLSGEETCARLRATPSGSALRIIAYTAHAFQEDRERLLAAGFDDILVKPISIQALETLTGSL